GRDADLLDDEVNTGDHLSHRVLDLEPRVHLDEVELAVLVEELDSADAAIAELSHSLGHNLADARSLTVVECRRQRLLPQLLMPPLQRAIALAKMDCVALAVAEYLDLDMAGMAEIFLEIHSIVAEACLGLNARRGKRRVEFLFDISDLHAAATAASRG